MDKRDVMDSILRETDLSVRLRLSCIDSRLTHGRSIEKRIDDMIAALIELKLALRIRKRPRPILTPPQEVDG